jgi:uncharacterized protein (TIGR03435 family)
MVRALVAAGLMVLGVGSVEGQLLHASGARPSFAVASIRPSGDEEQWPARRVQMDSFKSTKMTLNEVDKYAYGIAYDREMTGGPRWMGTDRFDIEAKPDEAEIAALGKMSNDDRDEQMRLMVQSLLEERFRLKVSFEKKELPVYLLTVLKSGLKCPKVAAKSPLAEMPPPRYRWDNLPPPPPPPPGMKMPPLPSAEESQRMTQPMHMGTSYWPFWLVVTALSHEPELDGRPVVDKTGLEGSYDCKMSWSRAGSEGTGPSLFTAIQEQMGLKLEPGKGPVEVLVVESIERPTEN